MACIDTWAVNDLMAYVNGLVQERRNSSTLAVELRLSCTNPAISDDCIDFWWHSPEKHQFMSNRGNTSVQIHRFVVMLCVVLVEYVQVSIPLNYIILGYMSGKLQTVKLSAQESGWI